jgi:hypothetical protein
MKCRQCGIEIADKALVCYRCGTATTEAKYKAPVPRKPSRSSLIVNVLALTVLVLFALYMQQLVTAGAPAELRYLIIVVAVVLVAIRLIARRRRS